MSTVRLKPERRNIKCPLCWAAALLAVVLAITYGCWAALQIVYSDGGLIPTYVPTADQDQHLSRSAWLAIFAVTLGGCIFVILCFAYRLSSELEGGSAVTAFAIALLAIFLAVIAMWWLTLQSNYTIPLPEATGVASTYNEIADAFNMSGSLFSALAFSGILIALIVQMAQLRATERQLFVETQLECLGWFRQQFLEARTANQALADGQLDWVNLHVEFHMQSDPQVIYMRFCSLRERRQTLREQLAGKNSKDVSYNDFVNNVMDKCKDAELTGFLRETGQYSRALPGNEGDEAESTDIFSELREIFWHVIQCIPPQFPDGPAKGMSAGWPTLFGQKLHSVLTDPKDCGASSELSLFVSQLRGHFKPSTYTEIITSSS